MCVYVSVLACVCGGGTYERDLVGNGTTVDPKTEDDSALGVGDGVECFVKQVSPPDGENPEEGRGGPWMETGRKGVWGENTQHPVVSFIPFGRCLVRA